MSRPDSTVARSGQISDSTKVPEFSGPNQRRFRAEQCRAVTTVDDAGAVLAEPIDRRARPGHLVCGRGQTPIDMSGLLPAQAQLSAHTRFGGQIDFQNKSFG